MKFNIKCLAVILLCVLISCSKEVQLPDPFGPVPSERQLAWHTMEYYAFVHFNMNTFTNMEWGFGDEKPTLFNPTQLDTRQWARTIKEAGMKGIIITAKHHDGFCLWPSKYTEHSVKNSPWKNGQGDLIKELSEACKEYGLKMGIYLSPWDRNHADYGESEYVEYFQNQLRELLTNYGEIFEVWFDGANGGSGYYGGANETRKIDNKSYYQWDKVIPIVRELQPNAVVFSDWGPDVRWVGNEEGWANETNWSILRRNEVYPGYEKREELQSGHENGTHWVPAECDVSIRPGWYYHQYEDDKVKSLEHLVKIYYQSVGRNASLLLNLPVDTRGLVHENDVKQLLALKHQIDKDFANNLVEEAEIFATNHRGGSKTYAPSKTIDDSFETYWATDDSVTEASITMAFDRPKEINRIVLQEYIPLGQRISKFTLEIEVDQKWQQISSGSTIGYKRILSFDTVEASKFRLHIKAKAAITIANIGMYRAPNLLTEPTISRDMEGNVSMNVADKNIQIYYTTDGTKPNKTSKRYVAPFLVKTPTTIKAIAYNPEDKEETAVKTQYFDIPKKEWKISSLNGTPLEKQAIDNNPKTDWKVNTAELSNYSIDLGNSYTIKGLTYLPTQHKNKTGLIENYSVYGSVDGKSWSQVAQGEFANIKANPIKQQIFFEQPFFGRYVALKAEKTLNDTDEIIIAEIDVITAKSKK